MLWNKLNTMEIQQIYTNCLAQGAYYVQSEGEAAVIDPMREPGPYLQRAKEGGATIKFVFETHFHADFVSGHLDLAKQSGATIVYGPGAHTGYEKYEAQDGEVFRVGAITIQALHTPGHTPESTAYLLRDASGRPYAIFTGDTLFIGDVGRPDLAQQSGHSPEDMARALYNSLREKIMPLPDDVLVYPAHGAGSACGKNMSAETWDTLGNQKRTNYALSEGLSVEAFVTAVTEGLQPPPPYFAQNAELNKSGYAALDEVKEKGLRALEPDAFEALATAARALVLDVREKSIFSKGFVPGSIFIGLEGNFASWSGTLISDLQQPILLVAPEGQEEEAVERLARVGYTHTLGYLKGGFEAWEAAGRETDAIETIGVAAFGADYESGQVEHVVDVRRPEEYEAGHVAGAQLLTLETINGHLHEVQPGKRTYLHCRSGYRSTIAASILKARGLHTVVNLHGMVDELLGCGLPAVFPEVEGQ